MNFNKVILGGKLVRDPQLRYLPNQTAVLDFGIAINRKYKTAAGEQKEEATFVDITAWGKTGEVINQYFKKGDSILVEGSLKLEQWDDKEGNKRSKLKVNLENFSFAGSRKSDDGGQGSGRPGGFGGKAAQNGGNRLPENPESPIGTDPQFDDSDIPF